jgi:hypothetical protein
VDTSYSRHAATSCNKATLTSITSPFSTSANSGHIDNNIPPNPRSRPYLLQHLLYIAFSPFPQCIIHTLSHRQAKHSDILRHRHSQAPPRSSHARDRLATPLNPYEENHHTPTSYPSTEHARLVFIRPPPSSLPSNTSNRDI